MIELNEKAGIYAEENVINVLKDAIAKVYADGYRDGYKDRNDEISVDLRDSETEFIDLGLPSGTKWSSDYKLDGDERDYLPYWKAELLNIPTTDQWEELRDFCKWEFENKDTHNLYEARCVGPNGNIIRFEKTGKINICDKSEYFEVFFWIKNCKEGNDKDAVHMFVEGNSYKYGSTQIKEYFSGYKLPIRLVQKK